MKHSIQTKRGALLTSITMLVLFLISFYGVQWLFFSRSSLDKELLLIAQQINKTCPYLVDAETRLDRVLAQNGSIQYTYTLVKVKKTEMEIEPTDFIRFMEPQLLNLIQTSPDMKFYRDNKVTLSYLYKDNEGAVITKIDIPPTKYLK